ncbi:hypothetical protein F984_01799 [Acinetobacter nosocomialis NIPH 2119]|nr:hypothetical protein F984_01799 [Acinetobacter nosocomialis NIPH 2119]SSV54081.1 Uncharacterised protein [Acinetobacter nosocomialis]
MPTKSVREIQNQLLTLRYLLDMKELRPYITFEI